MNLTVPSRESLVREKMGTEGPAYKCLWSMGRRGPRVSVHRNAVCTWTC